jgi:hypothetical protein
MKMITMSKGITMLADWKEQIELEFSRGNQDFKNESFLAKIWEMSLSAFDMPREVQVVVDNHQQLWMSHGTPGLVWFSEDPVGMKLPIQCWIHTHPFGSAYFSGTDWKTIKSWELVLDCAIVLGGLERMTWTKDDPYTYFERYEDYGIPETQSKLDDWGEEE